MWTCLHATVVTPVGPPGEWVLLHYWLPREPSTPRIAVWRQLRRLGVAQLSDGLVALPADARTREQLEWVAGRVVDAAGTAGVWMARPASLTQERALAAAMTDARAAEYAALQQEATEACDLPQPGRSRAARRFRNELRRIRRRDFFPPPVRDAAVAALTQLVEKTSAAEAAAEPTTAGTLR